MLFILFLKLTSGDVDYTFSVDLSSSLNPNSASSKSTPLQLGYIEENVQDGEFNIFSIDLLSDFIDLRPIRHTASIGDDKDILDIFEFFAIFH